MGDCSNMYGCRPDGQQCDRIFQKFRWKSFLYKNIVRTVRHWRPAGCTSVASNFHIRLRASGRQFFNMQFPYLYCVRPNHEVQASGRLKWNWQFPSLMNARPDQVCQTSGWLILNCDSCLTETCVRTGYHMVRTVDWSSLSWNLERIRKPFENWEASGHAAETSGRVQVGTKTSRYSVGVRMEGARRLYRWCWSITRLDGMRHRPDWWNSGQRGIRTGWLDRPDGWQGTWISSD
jgi:hypothetical protein